MTPEHLAARNSDRAWVWSRTTGQAAEKLLLLAIVERADARGVCTATTKALAADLGVARSTVYGLLERLQARQLLDVVGTPKRFRLRRGQNRPA
jgi:DNA-binding IclR family transcriptional regulator